MSQVNPSSAPSADALTGLDGVEVLIDGPNMLTHLREACGGDDKVKFIYRALAAWIGARHPGESACGTMFVNVPANRADAMRQFVQTVRQIGLAVFAKPKDGASDIDDDIVEFAVRSTASSLVVLTHDRALLNRIDVGRPDASITVIGIREISGHAVRSERFQFVDVEEIAGFVSQPIPRVASLRDLPAEGVYLAALSPLVARRPPLAAAVPA